MKLKRVPRSYPLLQIANSMADADPSEFEGLAIQALREVVTSYHTGHGFGKTVDQVGRVLLAYDVGGELKKVDDDAASA